MKIIKKIAAIMLSVMMVLGMCSVVGAAGLFHELSMGRSNLLHPCYHISHIVSDSLVM